MQHTNVKAFLWGAKKSFSNVVQGLLDYIMVKGLYSSFGRIYTILMEVLSFWVQAPGLDPGLGEMFPFVGLVRCFGLLV